MGWLVLQVRDVYLSVQGVSHTWHTCHCSSGLSSFLIRTPLRSTSSHELVKQLLEHIFQVKSQGVRCSWGGRQNRRNGVRKKSAPGRGITEAVEKRPWNMHEGAAPILKGRERRVCRVREQEEQEAETPWWGPGTYGTVGLACQLLSGGQRCHYLEKSSCSCPLEPPVVSYPLRYNTGWD